MKNLVLPYLAPLITGFLVFSCGGQQSLHVPADMPEICKDLDFTKDVGMREMCGVKVRSYRGYTNIPEHRILLHPKGTTIVKKGERLELRLENTLPYRLPQSWVHRINFGEAYRTVSIKSKMDYAEFFKDNGLKKTKIIRLDIPLDDGSTESLCFTLIPQTESVLGNRGYAGTLESMACYMFEDLKDQHTQ